MIGKNYKKKYEQVFIQIYVKKQPSNMERDYI